MNKKTVLFIEWNTSGREFDMQFPLMYFFEKKLNWNVEYKCSFNLPDITSCNPDMILLSSTGGAGRGLEILNWIDKSNILVFSSFTEGMFRKNDLDQFLWGWNEVKKYKEELRMLWSMDSYNMSIKKYPRLKKQLRVSGGTGFDKYSLLKYENIIDTKYKKIIGYAGYDFHGSLNSPKKDIIAKEYGSEYIDVLSQEIENVKNIMKYLIEKNDDILFLIKSHPGDEGKSPKEIEGLENFDNVKIISSPQVPIASIISISDIWVSLNSTTIIDAWLCNIPTISFFNDKMIKTSPSIDGSIVETDKKQINLYIQEFYKNGNIYEFNKLSSFREKFISDTVGFLDGLNHVRYMSFLKPYIDKIEEGKLKKGKWNISLKDKSNQYVRHIVYSVSSGKYNIPYINNWAKIYDRFKLNEILEFKRNQYPNIDKFYANNQQTIDDIYNNYRIEFDKKVNEK